MKAKYGPGVIMQEDGAYYHHSKLAKLLKEAWKVRTCTWPAQSPDLSPIENIWSILKQKITRRRHRLRTAKEMQYAIQSEWREIKPYVFYKLAMTMPKRLHLLKRNHWGPIKY
jgi:transposase